MRLIDLNLDRNLPTYNYYRQTLWGWEREQKAMQSFLIACAAAIVIAIIGGVVLDGMQEPVSKAYTTQYVRLGA